MSSINAKKKSKWLWIGLAAAIVVVGVLVVPRMLQKPAAMREETVKKQSIESFYTFSGSVRSANTQNVVANGATEITKVYVSEGQLVKKDTVLFKTNRGQKIKAQIDGTVSDVYVKVDDQIASGTAIADVYDFDHLQISIKVDEYELHAIQKDKAVSVTISSINKTIEGTISSVSNTATNDNGVAYFTAIIDLPKDEAIKVGMTAEAKIANQQALDVLTISMAALQFDGQNKPFVWLKQADGSTVRQEVVTGVNDGKIVEIKQGLSESQTVAFTPVVSTTTNGFNMPRMGGGQRETVVRP